ncbi:hypothetical protein FOXG_21410 [Fusarium oxysporum f. sp. lycopersici 4287]|uniref:Uncharacterized protein n=1 Tax=Fusarium oxysporum f. sp. lycopersici (strain 4287 / CBS 123668 / FGSC 9935 / NRRL 34936) TaxID=426428 RepID=A0A0J9VXV8_FUSO4|nr:hypothetical protein FOXG_21410 [Fusarium oxysporum f. sp. lycopersici 4287]KNB15628.1 hypothetical protein FOXG_21410 [Fusarium oxysporum f. sp. lycopersici 4287]
MISRVNTKLCHLDVTSRHKFIEALGINAPVDISNLLTKDSTKLRAGDHQREPWHFALFAIPNKSRLRIGEFATLDDGLSSILHDLLSLGENICRLGVTVDSFLPVECLQFTRCPIAINIYSSPDPESKARCERVLDGWKIYLQHPLFVPPGIQYSNPHLYDEVDLSRVGLSESLRDDQSMVGPRKNLREVQLCYLVFENLAPPELKEGLRYLLQKVWTSDSIETIRWSIGATTEKERKSLEKLLKGAELEYADKSYHEEKGLEWLVEPCPEASSKDQLLGKWEERILQTV